MNITVIQQLLEGFVESLGLPLQRENTRNSAQSSWVRTTLLPAQPAVRSLGIQGSNQLTGLLQVDVMTPVDQGTDQSNTWADTIINACPKGLTLQDGDVLIHIEMAWRFASNIDGKWRICPVMIRWRTHYK